MVACANLSPSASDVGDVGQGIRARAYSNTNPLTDNLVVTNSDPHTGESNVQANPSITELPDTGFLVTWTDNLTAGFGTGTDIRDELYSQLGVAIGTEFDIAATPTASSATPPRPAFITATSWWRGPGRRPLEPIDDNVYARIFTSPGNGSTPFLVNSDTAGTQKDVALAAYGTDQFVAAWTQDEGGQGNSLNRSKLLNRRG